MSNDYQIKSGASSDYANVDPAGRLAIRSASAAAGGFIVGDAEADPGTITGERHQYAMEINSSRQLRVGYDNLLFCENFPGTTLNTAQWFTGATTMSAALAEGALRLISTGAINTNVSVHSYRPIPLLGTASTYI